MQIQVNTGNHIQGSEALTETVQNMVADGLNRFEKHLTRVEVHIIDENSHKSGSDDKTCTIEARVTGQQPIAVKHQSATVEEAITGAIGKLERSLDSMLGKLGRR